MGGIGKLRWKMFLQRRKKRGLIVYNWMGDNIVKWVKKSI
jgi:hypothetical protein